MVGVDREHGIEGRRTGPVGADYVGNGPVLQRVDLDLVSDVGIDCGKRQRFECPMVRFSAGEALGAHVDDMHVGMIVRGLSIDVTKADSQAHESILVSSR
jgi:hypothetical protein